jgi:hypothetical protein
MREVRELPRRRPRLLLLRRTSSAGLSLRDLRTLKRPPHLRSIVICAPGSASRGPHGARALHPPRRPPALRAPVARRTRGKKRARGDRGEARAGATSRLAGPREGAGMTTARSSSCGTSAWLSLPSAPHAAISPASPCAPRQRPAPPSPRRCHHPPPALPPRRARGGSAPRGDELGRLAVRGDGALSQNILRRGGPLHEHHRTLVLALGAAPHARCGGVGLGDEARGAGGRAAERGKGAAGVDEGSVASVGPTGPRVQHAPPAVASQQLHPILLRAPAVARRDSAGDAPAGAGGGGGAGLRGRSWGSRGGGRGPRSSTRAAARGAAAPRRARAATCVRAASCTRSRGAAREPRRPTTRRGSGTRCAQARAARPPRPRRPPPAPTARRARPPPPPWGPRRPAPGAKWGVTCRPRAAQAAGREARGSGRMVERRGSWGLQPWVWVLGRGLHGPGPRPTRRSRGRRCARHAGGAPRGTRRGRQGHSLPLAACATPLDAPPPARPAAAPPPAHRAPQLLLRARAGARGAGGTKTSVAKRERRTDRENSPESASTSRCFPSGDARYHVTIIAGPIWPPPPPAAQHLAHQAQAAGRGGAGPGARRRARQGRGGGAQAGCARGAPAAPRRAHPPADPVCPYPSDPPAPLRAPARPRRREGAEGGAAGGGT